MGATCSIFWSAILPLAAVPTSSIDESEEIASLMIRRMTTESSTTRTRIWTRLHSCQSEQCQLFLEGVCHKRLHDVLIGAGGERSAHVMISVSLVTMTRRT